MRLRCRPKIQSGVWAKHQSNLKLACVILDRGRTPADHDAVMTYGMGADRMAPSSGVYTAVEAFDPSRHCVFTS
jgi:hypothetical protein